MLKTRRDNQTWSVSRIMGVSLGIWRPTGEMISLPLPGTLPRRTIPSSFVRRRCWLLLNTTTAGGNGRQFQS